MSSNTPNKPRWLQSLELRNFQLHEHSKIEFHPGVNLICGKNSCGKSSSARAIRYLAFGQPRRGVDDLIRRGKSSCTIKATMSDGSWVFREKGKGINSYVINTPLLSGAQKELSGFGTQVPPEVTTALGFGPLTLAKTDDIELNFASQGEAAFMLSESDPEIARWMYTLTSLDDIRGAIDDLALDHRRSGQTIKAHEEKIEEIKETLQEYVGLDNKVAEMEEIHSAIQRLENPLGDVQSLKSLLSKMIELRRQAIPVKQRKQQEENVLDTLSEDAISSLEQKTKNVQKLKQIRQKIDGLLVKIATTETRLRLNIKKSKVSFGELEADATTLSQLQKIATKMERTERKVSKATTTLSSSRQKLDAAQSVYSQAKQEMFFSDDTDGPTCPLCGGDIEGDGVEHILEEYGHE